MKNTENDGAEAVPSPPPQQVLMQLSQGMWVAQTVATAARLGIADALAQSQPQESTTLAAAVGADAQALARLLRALASIGVPAEPLPHQYTLTPIGELLKSQIMQRGLGRPPEKVPMSDIERTVPVSTCQPCTLSPWKRRREAAACGGTYMTSATDLLYQLVGAGEQRRRHGETKCLRRN
jgi:hypothetical protein